MVVDSQKQFVGIDRPILESMAVYPLSIGETGLEGPREDRMILDKARKKRIPIL